MIWVRLSLKKVKGLGVNFLIMKKYKFIVLVFVCLFFGSENFFAQVKLIPTNNKGGYTVNFVDGQIKKKKLLMFL